MKKKKKVKDAYELMTDGTAERERFKRCLEEGEEDADYAQPLETVSEDPWDSGEDV